LIGAVLDHATVLDPARLAAVADLERRVVAADGGRLKLEWGTLRARSGERVEDLLRWDGDRLVGFLGLYAFGAPTVELAGMVDPAWRRRRIATSLLDAALQLCRQRGHGPVLLVTPRNRAGGREFALGRGCVLHHSEHALELTGDPVGSPSDPRTSIRPVGAGDTDAVDALLLAGFGWRRPDAEAPGHRDGTLVVERDGEVVGTLRVTHDSPGDVGVYGLVVRPDRQGRGIGRDVLGRVCRQALADDADRVHLEVAVDNDRALGLYTSLGFRPAATEDYYSVPAG
jgi:ribosomal protein S18 acetylase RimI-like enzyme